MSLPEPKCRLGYTGDQLDQIFGNRIEKFRHWMRGQTMAVCDDHGPVVYRWDLDRYLAGLPNID